MYIKYAVYGFILSATVASAFNPYHKPAVPAPKAGSVGGATRKEWKPLKAPRDAMPFQPVDLEQWKPLNEMHIKRVPIAVCISEGLWTMETEAGVT